MRYLNRLFAVGSLCAGLAGGGLTGCTTDKEAKETGRTTEQVKTDKAVTEQVTKALATAPVYKYPEVKVSTLNGEVLLSGFVSSEDQKQAATQIAQQGSGGRPVHNNLMVQPLTPTGRTDQTPPGTAPAPPPAPAPAQPNAPQNPPPAQQPNQGTP